AGREGAVVVALDEAEGDVAERRRDLDAPVRAAAIVFVLERIGEERASALLEELNGVLEALHAEAEAHDARRVALQVARGLARLRERRRDADARLTRAEDDRLLAAPLREIVARARDLFEVEHVFVELPRALEVLDDEMIRVVTEQSEAVRHARELAIIRARGRGIRRP